MNNDYIWNKEGQPDPEVERLENLLAAKRLSPGRPAWLQDFVANPETPAVAPNVVPFAPRRHWWQNYQMPQAIAAAVALCVLAVGAWRVLRDKQDAPPKQIAANATQPTIAPEKPSLTTNAAQPAASPSAKPNAPRRASARVVAARWTPPREAAKRAPATVRAKPEFTPEEARKAKADLLLAFHIINAKLDLAQQSMAGQTVRLPELGTDKR